MHRAVLLREAINNLNLKKDDVVLDATLGGGGHATEILERIGPSGKLIAIDKDPEAIERAKGDLKFFRDQIVFINDDFRNIKKVFSQLSIKAINAALFDLGMSSFQIECVSRGFSFLKDGPLDMRFNVTQSLTAADVVNKFRVDEIADILEKYGEERYARLIARAIINERRGKYIGTTQELVEIIRNTVGGRYARQRLHPACRTFQALRIFVNNELSAVEEGVDGAISYLHPGGRICVLSFHSLEDRIVKNIFRTKEKELVLKRVTKKPLVPSREEVLANPSSRSAKMRTAEKI